ncbi:MAG: FtsX-like permease family protein, partial [Gemmatimonadaceae bacterium]
FYLPGPSDTLADGMSRSWVTFIARGTKRPEELPVAIRHALQSLPGIKVISSKTMDDDLGIIRARANSRFTAWLFLLFGALGVSLASFGVYGVVAHAVAERRRELGVRVALGASSRDILEAVLRESVVVALAGAAGGLLLTKIGVVLLSQLAAEEIYNAPLFAAVAAFVVAVAALGALVPAMRATRIDPTESLRAE